MSYLIVPSDITVLENKQKVGRQRLPFWDSVGMAGMFPLYHRNFTKLNRAEMRSVLTKRYKSDDNSEETAICKARQESVSKQVKAHIGFWAGFGSFGGMTFWSFRKYNYQSKLICIPFLAYAGGWVGRCLGDLLQSRHQEHYRERFLGSLPAHVYYKGGES